MADTEALPTVNQKLRGMMVLKSGGNERTGSGEAGALSLWTASGSVMTGHAECKARSKAGLLFPQVPGTVLVQQHVIEAWKYEMEHEMGYEIGISAEYLALMSK